MLELKVAASVALKGLAAVKAVKAVKGAYLGRLASVSARPGASAVTASLRSVAACWLRYSDRRGSGSSVLSSSVCREATDGGLSAEATPNKDGASALQAAVTSAELYSRLKSTRPENKTSDARRAICTTAFTRHDSESQG